MEELDNFCLTNDLSLADLREKVGQLSPCDVTQETYNGNPFLHSICINENVTLEMVECILHSFPGVASRQTDSFDDSNISDNKTSSYALHCACYNKHCPSSVIKLLFKEYATAANMLSNVFGGVHDWDCKGLPLHYYLARDSNVDIDVVKLLAEAHPRSLITSDEEYEPCYPIHAAVYSSNSNNMKNILEYMLELEPSSIQLLDSRGRTPLSLACRNENIKLVIVEFLFNKWPEAFQMRNHYEFLPMHELCQSLHRKESDALAVLQFMLDIDPTLVRERDRDDYLPIHYAVNTNSFELCKVLIDKYPESVRLRTIYGYLPIHTAFDHYWTVADVHTIQYLLYLYPESINVWTPGGTLPIHRAAGYGKVDIIELLLKHNPDMASKRTTNQECRLPLHIASSVGYSLVVQVLYDAFPEAITIRDGSGRTPLELATLFCQSAVIRFLVAQLEYAQKARDMPTMTTPDENGWLPLHHALKDAAPLGSIKLLLKGNLSALLTTDYNIAFPLHLACEFSSVKVVKYLISERILEHCDTNKDSILHYACRGGNLEVVKYLLDDHTSLLSLTEVNEKGELPIHLLCEAGKYKVDIGSTEYIEIIWRMLLASLSAVVAMGG